LPTTKTLGDLRTALRAFAAARDWDRFHSPKNLAMALSAEAGELLEPFLWLTEDESNDLLPTTRVAVSEEMADVLIYLVRLADRLDIDLLDAAATKLAKNESRYPADLARGNALKYTDLPKRGGNTE
jgi:dCTP diphosphatase